MIDQTWKEEESIKEKIMYLITIGKKKKNLSKDDGNLNGHTSDKTLNFDPTTMKKFLWRRFYNVMKVFTEIVEIYFWVFFLWIIFAGLQESY